MLAIAACAGAVTVNFSRLRSPTAPSLKGIFTGSIFQPAGASNCRVPALPARKAVIYTYTDMHPDQHVANTLKAIQDWKAKQAK